MNHYISWAVRDEIDDTEAGIISGGGANSLNPADPRAVYSVRNNYTSWQYVNNANGWNSGDISVKCVKEKSEKLCNLLNIECSESTHSAQPVIPLRCLLAEKLTNCLESELFKELRKCNTSSLIGSIYCRYGDNLF